MYAESRQPVFKAITPKEAETFLSLNNFFGQRQYKPTKGRAYADNMDAGRQRRVEIAVVKVKETGVEYLMNGQHNLNAILLHRKPYQAVISYFTCETVEDAWRLFATFDVHASRSEQQFMLGRRGLFADERLHSVPMRVLQSCGSALYAIGNGTEPQFRTPASHSKTEKADLVDKYSDDVIFVNRYKEHSHLLYIGCVAAIISTYRVNPQKSVEFWDRVGDGAMMATTDHRRKLRDSLLRPNFLGDIRSGQKLQKAMFILCIAWWNSWRSGATRNAVKIKSMNDIPKVAE